MGLLHLNRGDLIEAYGKKSQLKATRLSVRLSVSAKWFYAAVLTNASAVFSSAFGLI